MTSHSSRQHKSYAPSQVTVWIVTVSDSRTPETDETGRLIEEHLCAAGHAVAGRTVLKDEAPEIGKELRWRLSVPAIDAVIANGGTGVSPRDVTADVVAGMLDKRLDGFGELFRNLSYAEIGPAAFLSRAVAGISQGKFLAALPGSPAAARLAMEKLLLPELPHLVGQLRRPR